MSFIASDCLPTTLPVKYHNRAHFAATNEKFQVLVCWYFNWAILKKKNERAFGLHNNATLTYTLDKINDKALNYHQ